MKIRVLLLFAVLLLMISPAVRADEGVEVEVVRLDGVSVVVFTPAEVEDLAIDIVEVWAASLDAENAPAFVLPERLTMIEEEAFAGIQARSVEVSPNVASIASRAFADNRELLDITIPANVVSIADDILDGCREDVVIYGTKGTEAEAFAKKRGLIFIDRQAGEDPVTPTPPVITPGPVRPPVILPFVPAK